MLQRYYSPRWIVAHVIVLVVVGLFARLGIWQLDRLDERRDQNTTIASRLALEPVGIGDLLDGVPPDQWDHRRVVVAGTFLPDDEVLIRSRTHNGEAGFHVVTPLLSDTGVAILVNRGWVPLDLDSPPIVPALPPVERVEVTGTVRESQSAPALGPNDPSDGKLARLYWIDIPRLQQQIPYELAPVSVELISQIPPQTGVLPIPVRARELTEGSHLAYAIQWFAFAIISLGGYAALLRRNRRVRAVGERVPSE